MQSPSGLPPPLGGRGQGRGQGWAALAKDPKGRVWGIEASASVCVEMCGNGCKVLQAGLASLIPICSYQVWGHLTRNSQTWLLSSRPEQALQTGSPGLLLLNNGVSDECAAKWIQSSWGERLRLGLKSPSEVLSGPSRGTFVTTLLESLFRDGVMGCLLWTLAERVQGGECSKANRNVVGLRWHMWSP